MSSSNHIPGPISPYIPPAHPILVSGNSSMPKLLLRARDGASAEVYLYGAQVTSWKPAGGEERLFLSSTARFQEDSAIRGGIPIIFPQFGPKGRLQKHGFARTMEWAIGFAGFNPEGLVTATLRLTDSRASWALWRHRFLVDLTITIGGPTLVLSLSIKNDGKKPFRFTGALHTYLRVREIADVIVKGLHGLPYRDLTTGNKLEDTDARLHIRGDVEVGRVYLNVPNPIQVQEQELTVQVAATGFPDMAVWNPGVETADAMDDMAADEHRHMLCVEPAVVAQPVWINPGDSWTGTQTLTVADHEPEAI